MLLALCWLAVVGVVGGRLAEGRFATEAPCWKLAVSMFPPGNTSITRIPASNLLLVASWCYDVVLGLLLLLLLGLL